MFRTILISLEFFLVVEIYLFRFSSEMHICSSKFTDFVDGFSVVRGGFLLVEQDRDMLPLDSQLPCCGSPQTLQLLLQRCHPVSESEKIMKKGKNEEKWEIAENENQVQIKRTLQMQMRAIDNENFIYLIF